MNPWLRDDRVTYTEAFNPGVGLERNSQSCLLSFSILQQYFSGNN